MKERKGRGKEREVPTLLIENSEFSHAAHITKTHSFPKGGHPEYCLVCLVHAGRPIYSRFPHSLR